MEVMAVLVGIADGACDAGDDAGAGGTRLVTLEDSGIDGAGAIEGWYAGGPSFPTPLPESSLLLGGAGRGVFSGTAATG